MDAYTPADVAAWQALAGQHVTASTPVGTRVARWTAKGMAYGTVTSITASYVGVTLDNGGTDNGPLTFRAWRIVPADESMPAKYDAAPDWIAGTNVHAIDMAARAVPAARIWDLTPARKGGVRLSEAPMWALEGL